MTAAGIFYRASIGSGGEVGRRVAGTVDAAVSFGDRRRRAHAPDLSVKSGKSDDNESPEHGVIMRFKLRWCHAYRLRQRAALSAPPYGGMRRLPT